MKWPISDQITPNLNTVCTAPAARRHPLHTPCTHPAIATGPVN